MPAVPITGTSVQEHREFKASLYKVSWKPSWLHRTLSHKTHKQVKRKVFCEFIFFTMGFKPLVQTLDYFGSVSMYMVCVYVCKHVHIV